MHSVPRFSRTELYDEIEAEYIANLEAQGIKFASECIDELAKQKLIDKLANRGALIRNGGASISLNKLSSACIACTGDKGSKTFLLSLQCNRKCYFCFNPNQLRYEEQLQGINNWRKELNMFDSLGIAPTHLALTGGEPLIHTDETLEFFSTVSKRYPTVHTRLYTTGDILDAQLLDALSKAGLTEIRFSIKMDDKAEEIDQTLQRIALAQDYIPQVMVEMPVIPGTERAMQELLEALERLGIFGINLLEFCFPHHSWHEFEKRGFTIKNPPFKVLYNYHYAGGLPVAGSEELALALLSYALDQNMKLGVHYCSLENKHRDEIYQLNMPYAELFETYFLDPDDFFLKTVVIFGEDTQRLCKILSDADIPHKEDIKDHSVQFDPRYFYKVANLEIPMYCSYNIALPHEDGVFIRELKLIELLAE